MFRQDPRWLGADAALSIPLEDDRIVWLFGDTFIGDGKSPDRAGSAMIRNSIGIEEGNDPLKDRMRFFWRQDAKGRPASFFPEKGGEWYWPGHGAQVDDDSLAIFLTKVALSPGTPLGFKVSGHALAVVENIRASPDAWAVRIIDGPPDRGFVPAAAVVREGKYFIALAVANNGTADGALVRYAPEALRRGDLSAAEWWTGNGWSTTEEKAVVVIPGAGPEGSLHWEKKLGCYIHVASHGFGATRIAVRMAPALTGPWSPPRIVFEPEESRAPEAFVYAAKAHPELNVVGGLAVTYVANTFQPDQLFTNEGFHLYWPRFVVIPDSLLTSASEAGRPPTDRKPVGP